MSSLLNRFGSKKVKFDLELTIHSLGLEKNSPCLIKIRAKRGKKNQQETQSIQYYPNLKQIQFSQILNFECTLLKKNEKYLKKDIQLKVLEIQGKSELTIGTLTIEFNSLAEKGTSINFQEYQLKDSKEAKGKLCLSLNLFEQTLKKEHKKGGKNLSLNTVRRAFSVDEADSIKIRQELENEGVSEERKEEIGSIKDVKKEDQGRRGSVQSLRKAFCVPDMEVEETKGAEFEEKGLKKKKFETIRGGLVDLEGLEEDDSNIVRRFGVQGLEKVVINKESSEEIENEEKPKIQDFEYKSLQNEENQSFEKVEDEELNNSWNKTEVIEQEGKKTKSRRSSSSSSSQSKSKSKSGKKSIGKVSLSSKESFEMLKEDIKSEKKNIEESFEISNIFISPDGKNSIERKNSALSLNSSGSNFIVESKERKYSIQSFESGKSLNNEKSVSIKSINDSSSSDSDINKKDSIEVKNNIKEYSSYYSETEEITNQKPKKNKENTTGIVLNDSEVQINLKNKEEPVFVQGEVFECSDDFLDTKLTHIARGSVKSDSKSVSSSISIGLGINEEITSPVNEKTLESPKEKITPQAFKIELPEVNINVNTKNEELTEKKDDYEETQIINTQITIEKEDFFATPDDISEKIIKKEINSTHIEENIIETFKNPSSPIPKESKTDQNSSNESSSESEKKSSKESSSESEKSSDKSEKIELSIQDANEESNEDIFDKEFLDSSSSIEETSADIQIPVTDLKEIAPNSASQELLLNLKEKESGLPESRNTTCCGSCTVI